jgi:DNA-binding MarR family transcriptional regulator
MSLDELDPVLVPPKRLAAAGILAASNTVEFAFLREHLGLGDSDLSKQMSALADAGYVTSRKTGKGADRRTWFKLTGSGRRAVQRHLAALNALVQQAPVAPASDS